MTDNSGTRNGADEHRNAAVVRPSMTMAEIQAALDDETNPRHEEARRHAADTAKNLAPSLKKLSDSVASQTNAGEIMSQLPGHHNAALAWEFTDATPYEIPAHQVIDIPALADTGWTDEMEEAMQEKSDRERRQDDIAEASLETMQAVAARIQQLNDKMEEVDERLESGNNSATIWNGLVLAIATLTLIATIIGIFN